MTIPYRVHDSASIQKIKYTSYIPIITESLYQKLTRKNRAFTLTYKMYIKILQALDQSSKSCTFAGFFWWYIDI